MGFIISIIVLFVILILEMSLDFNRFVFTPGNLNFYLSIKSFVFILVPAIVFLYYSGQEKRHKKSSAWKLLLGKEGKTSESEVKRVMVQFRAGGNYILFLSGVFMIQAVISLLFDLSDPSVIGRYMAEAMIPLCYGIIGKMVFYAAEHRLNSLNLNHQ